MSDELVRTLRAVRRRLKISRSLEMAVRWTLYASILACVCLTASKFLPIAPAVAAGVAILPLAAAFAAAARRISLHECAALVDGSFRLEERVATAAELAGDSAMSRAVLEDARRALASVDVRSVARLRWPREAPLLAVTAALLLALALAPSPAASTVASPELEAVARREAELMSRAAADPRLSARAKELERIAELLRSGELQAALAALRSLEAGAGMKMLEGGLRPEEARAMRELADLAAASGAAVGRELAARGVETGGGVPVDVGARLERAARAAAAAWSDRPADFDAPRMAAGATPAVDLRPRVEESIRRHQWDPRYDEIVRRYYEERP